MSGPIEKTPLMPPLSVAEKEARRSLQQHVEMLAGVIGIRHDSRPSSLDATVAYITQQWQQMDQYPVVQPYPTAAGEAKNLVVEWKGDQKPDDVIVLGAHYDTVESTPGADDNASAVAMLLEVCQRLRGLRFSKTLRFVAFANEEPPHFVGPTMGSRVYAKACRQRGEDIHAMVCLEMVGYFDCSPHSQSYPEELPAIAKPLLRKQGDFIAVVSDVGARRSLSRFTRAFKKAALDFPVVSVPLPHARKVLWVSDHGPFWDEGYPAMIVTDTSWFRNPHYHLMSDRPDTLDYDRMARVAEGVIAGIAALAT